MARITVFADDGDPSTEDIELAKGSELHVSGPAMPYITSYGSIGGTHYWRVMSSIPDLKVRLREAKLPITPTGLPTTHRLLQHDYDSLKMTLAILVRQMGGAVTFTSSDFVAAQKSDIRIAQYKDPWYQVVTVEDQ